MQTIACTAGYNQGGLGLHFGELVERARLAGLLERYYTTSPKTDDLYGKRVSLKSLPYLQKYTPIRFSPAWLNFSYSDLFDRAVAARLEPGQAFIGFSGQSLHSFRRAKASGYKHLGLLAANSHVDNIMRKHGRAIKLYPFEQSWLNSTQQHKTLKEYLLADVIEVASEYSLQTFLDEGFPSSKLHIINFPILPRFTQAPARTDDGVFRVVYTGALTVPKGIPILIEAFSRLPLKSAELVLVGGWYSRGMRKYLQGWQVRDARIKIAPGDPLPHLRQADVYVHPTFEDGFAYAPMEALACGVPVIVTADTGMKEHVREGENGYIVPTGDWQAIYERLQHLMKDK